MNGMDSVAGRRIPSVSDVLLIILVLAAAFSVPRFIAGTPGGTSAEVRIFSDNMLMVVVAAAHDTVVSVAGVCGTSQIEVSAGRVRFISSCCRQHTCIDRGWISRDRTWLLCLPNRVMVRFAGDAGMGGPDAVSE